MNDLYDAISISGFYGTRIFVYFFNFDVSFAAVSRDVTFSRTEFILICLIWHCGRRRWPRQLVNRNKLTIKWTHATPVQWCGHHRTGVEYPRAQRYYAVISSHGQLFRLCCFERPHQVERFSLVNKSDLFLTSLFKFHLIASRKCPALVGTRIRRPNLDLIFSAKLITEGLPEGSAFSLVPFQNSCVHMFSFFILLLIDLLSIFVSPNPDPVPWKCVHVPFFPSIFC